MSLRTLSGPGGRRRSTPSRSNPAPLAAVGLAFAALAGTSSAQEAVALKSNVQVRATPSERAASRGVALIHDVYPLLARQGDWVEVQYADRRGWLPRRHVEAKRVPVQRVKAGSGLNVRSGPGASYRRLGTLPAGAPVALQGTSQGWQRVSFGGRTGWVAGNLLTSGGGAAPNAGGGASTTTRPAPGGGAPLARTTTPTPSNLPRSRVGFVQLPSAGAGFYGYYAATKRWGKPELVYGIMRVGSRWAGRGHRIGIGDISLQNGGQISGHVSHRRGVDVDVRPMRNDGREQPTTIHQRVYSRELTRQVIELFRAELRSTTLVLFNDRQIRGTTWYRNHDNHFHLRIAG